MKEMIKDWLKKATNFKENAILAKKNKLYDVACFSAQQAVELLLKGIIVANSGSRPFTHSLIELYEIIEVIDLGKFPEEIIDCLRTLANHYLQARYPDSRFTDYTDEEADKALKCLEEVFVYANKFLQED